MRTVRGRCHDGSMSENLLATLDQALTFAERVVDDIAAEQRNGPTPCPEFNVTALVSHLVSGTRWYADIPEKGMADPSTLTDIDLSDKDLAAVFRTEAGRARAAWTEADLGAEFPTPFQPWSGAQMAEFMIMELAGHGLDLALATEQPLRPDDELMATTFRLTAAMGDNLRVPKMMGPAVPVPADAPLVDRFLGLIGRDPNWSPGSVRPDGR